jgi:hypothetical protein
MNADNIKDGKRIAVTHGELVFLPIDELPKGEVQSTKSYIAGHSETGHHHVLEADTEFKVVEGETRAVLLNDVAKLFHQKTYDIHETRTLAPGVYKILQKTEYDPFQKVIRNIWD